MADKLRSRRRDSRGGGVFIVMALIAGTTVGAIRGQPVIGLLTGCGIGIAIAALFWMIDRRR